jgi:hypothetical protein
MEFAKKTKALDERLHSLAEQVMSEGSPKHKAYFYAWLICELYDNRHNIPDETPLSGVIDFFYRHLIVQMKRLAVVDDDLMPELLGAWKVFIDTTRELETRLHVMKLDASPEAHHHSS